MTSREETRKLRLFLRAAAEVHAPSGARRLGDWLELEPARGDSELEASLAPEPLPEVPARGVAAARRREMNLNGPRDVGNVAGQVDKAARRIVHLEVDEDDAVHSRALV